MSDDGWSPQEWVVERVDERTEPHPTGERGVRAPVVVGVGQLLADSGKGPYNREQIKHALRNAADADEVFYWRGLCAPTEEVALQAVVENARQCPRHGEALIQAVETFRSDEDTHRDDPALAAGGGGRP